RHPPAVPMLAMLRPMAPPPTTPQQPLPAAQQSPPQQPPASSPRAVKALQAFLPAIGAEVAHQVCLFHSMPISLSAPRDGLTPFPRSSRPSGAEGPPTRVGDHHRRPAGGARRGAQRDH